jgi:ABC-type sugar transport system permease subunit
MPSRRKSHIGRRKENLFYYGLLVIPLVQFALFYVCVNFNSILLAFQRYDYSTGTFVYDASYNWNAIANDFTASPIAGYCFYNSFLVYIFGLVVTTPLSILFSYWLCMHKGFPAEFFKVMLFLPSIIPGIVLALVYKFFVDGALPSLLEDWFNVRLSMGLLFNTSTAMWMIVIFLILTGFGTNVVLYTGAMSGVSRDQIEAAEMDGCGEWGIVWHIVLPAIYPTFTTMMVLSVAGYFTNQASLFSFYGGTAPSQIYTWGYYLFVKVIGSSATMADYPYAAAYGLAFTLVAAPITILAKTLLEKLGPSEDDKRRKRNAIERLQLH